MIKELRKAIVDWSGLKNKYLKWPSEIQKNSRKYMGQSEKVAIINSFVLSNFNYCPLVWHFSYCESITKIEKIQKRCLRIILNDYESDYETLLCSGNKPTMEIGRWRTLAVEIFKTPRWNQSSLHEKCINA